MPCHIAFNSSRTAQPAGSAPSVPTTERSTACNPRTREQEIGKTRQSMHARVVVRTTSSTLRNPQFVSLHVTQVPPRHSTRQPTGLLNPRHNERAPYRIDPEMERIYRHTP
ncbi:hypothetical protein AG1IA_07295 [Rhizoctonia solani AG-1 IA]|uniref:Uncharacterized protein n=1 Tax=Thanatephorus cucumeris (strain AG1-IA) TaxID=983506 RepID=L8WKE3_THACA|nr:hypothetical protein AG1IA_07295 [Rhizoctonia solani AG-1 IA]